MKTYTVAPSKWPGRWIVRHVESGRTSAIRNTRESAEKYADKLNFIASGRGMLKAFSDDLEGNL